jgi:hypothetical protein
LQNLWEQGLHLLHSWRSALQIMQLREPSLRVIAEWALCRHQLGIGAPLFSVAGATVVLRTMILAVDRAHAADVLVKFSI